jgi:hypothetical protein
LSRCFAMSRVMSDTSRTDKDTRSRSALSREPPADLDNSANTGQPP